MEDEDIPNKAPSLWIPMSNPGDVAILAKLGEELGECISAKDRCLAQGMDEAEPVSKKINRVWLEEEIADVMAMTSLVIARFGLDRERINSRAKKKVVWKGIWIQMLDKLGFGQNNP